MWLIVSSLSLHSLHLLFCCVSSILALIWLVLTALSRAAIWRNSVSLLYHLLVRSNSNFLHISLWITLPTRSCLALYSFCAYLLHLLIMSWIVSFLSPHNVHLLFCCVLSILVLILLVLMAFMRFSHQCYLGVFHCSLRDNKLPQGIRSVF